MDAVLSGRCAHLNTAIDRLSLLSAHDALILFRVSFSAPKLMHTLRCAPCATHPTLEHIDIMLRKGVCAITNLDLTDLQCLQASLSVKEGGLGVRRVTSLAPSAFLASAAGTETPQQLLLIRSVTVGSTNPTVTSVRSTWSSAHRLPSPSDDIVYRQSAWNKPVITSDREILTSSLSDSIDKARLQAVRAPHSGDWLHALPLSACGLRLDDNAVHVAVGLRLGANICEPHQCPCGAMTDAKGLHGLSCKGGTGRSARHHSLNDLVWRALGKVNIPSVQEPSGLSRSDGKRPDGLTLIINH